MTFEALGLRVEVLKSLNDLGFSVPTPIQEKAIPHLMKEKSDFVGLAQTGTGKTAAFGLPLISNIIDKNQLPQGLILCPTRELCLQISKDLIQFSKYLDITILPIYGGVDIRKQMTEVKRGVEVIVATPGRLMDLINRRVISLKTIRYVVLDEADEMLNMGFKEDIDSILESTPAEKNVWLFSATMPKEVANIAAKYMHDPFEVSIGHKNQSNENIQHTYYQIREKDRYAALKRLIDFNPDIYGLIFCRTRTETANVAQKLSGDGYNAEPLHGDLSQAMRDMVMNRFRKKEVQLLIATDVAARGLDVDSISHVIHYNLPDDIENYTHRSGRTARAGKTGESLVLLTPKEAFKVKAIERQIRMEFTKGVVPDPEEICRIQLSKLVSKVISTNVREKDIAPFLPTAIESFEGMSKEEVIKLFISAEFNRFIEYYERAGDLNSNEKDTRSGKSESFGSKRGNDSNKTRFFVNIGKRDGLNVGGLLRVVCDSTGLKSNNVGRIDIMASFAFFDTDTEYADKVISKLNGVEYEGHKVSVEISGDKGGGGGSDDGRGRRDFKPRRTNLRDERPKRRESSSNHKPRRY
ncbi:MAG: DEAD/DEAH box helicase [Flavobacteriia bacterium]|jgi:ATP-dependent RNA helicase DeaD|nr:DEAD/DEAH box helicase [Flavobacteriia bacterium]NBV68219.1 DEAD/DEAH box helicase [Flavobacteriia bacterium]NBV91734.1 DEAD/DEAH box helicase [Flavobacteriia bacterium]NBY39911.1 DEAD/DEAH box helicase [Flavobacteriia bacterium]